MRELPRAGAARCRAAPAQLLTFLHRLRARAIERARGSGREAGERAAVEDSGALGVLLGDLVQASRPELRRRTGVWALVFLPAPPVLAHINIAISRHVASQLSEVGPGRPTAADALAKGGRGEQGGGRQLVHSDSDWWSWNDWVGASPRSALSRHVTASPFPASGLGHEAQQGTGNVCGNTVTKLL